MQPNSSAYTTDYQRSLHSPAHFWAEQATRIPWRKKPTEILTLDNAGLYRWYADGELNTCYAALDFHVENGRAGQPALIYDSPVTSQVRTYTYGQLRDDVALLAGVLHNLGVGKGDTVVIYMPMVPEAVMAMLACARLGAVHSVVFGGFAPPELAARIDDVKPRVVLSASCGIEFNNVIPYKPLLNAALERAKHQPDSCLILQRPQCLAPLDAPHDLDWHSQLSKASPVGCTPVLATDPLYVLYTSGTTGKPKGIMRDNGGHAVALAYSMEAVYAVKPGDVFWAASDLGWAVGHSYIVYAPLLTGCTTILFEGKPVRTPDPGTFWRVIAEHRVKVFFTAPTAFRAIRKEDPEGNFKKPYDLTSLRTLFVAGERCDPPTLTWLEDLLKIPVIDHWWQTESGWPMVANQLGINPRPVKHGSSSQPVCGFDLQILNEEGVAVPPGQEGLVCLKTPLPPGCFPTLWNDNARFFSSYMDRFPGYYLTGDGGYIDEDGYVFIMGRVDDVINVAGHRLSTGEMEEVVGAHPAVAECAVVGITCPLRGQRPVGFVVLKDGQQIETSLLEKQLIDLLREKIGAVAYFRNALIVKRLPKTRSGKILRKTIRQLADDEVFTTPATIDDPRILDEIKEVLMTNRVGIAFSD